MITSTTAKMTYTVAEGVTEYAIGFVYQTNPDNTPQIKVYVNDSVNNPLVYGTNYTLSQDGLKIELASGAETGDRLTIIRNIPVVQLSDYVVGRIDPEQIEKGFDLAVERDQQQSARITVTEEQLAAHDERITNIEEVVPESAATDNLLATVSDIPTDLAELTNSPGYITGITSSDVTTALGYTPYDSSNPAGYTTNTGTVTSVNNVLPVGGNVTLEMPTAVQSDWNQADNTKVDYIKNKPTLGTAAAAATTDFATAAQGALAATAVQPGDLATVATSGAYSDLSGTPTIPTVNNATITFSQGGVTKGTITLNQSSDETISLDAGGSGTDLPDQTGHSGEFLTTNGTAASWSAAPTELPTQTGQSGKFLKTDGSSASWVGVAYSDVSGTPTIPTVNDSTITFTQGGVTKGTITTNQSSASTISLDAAMAVWGSITGTLNDQTDLKNVFDEKIDGVTFVGSGGTGSTYSDIASSYTQGQNPILKWGGRYALFAGQNTVGTTYFVFGGFTTDYGIQFNKINSDDTRENINIPLNHIVVEFQAPTSSNNYTWYRKYADGWVEQGGYVADRQGSVVLPVTMADTYYMITHMLRLSGNVPTAAQICPYVKNVATTGFDFYNNPTGTTTWKVEGMAATN